MKSGNLNFLEPSGPLQACNGTALPFNTRIITVINTSCLIYYLLKMKAGSCSETSLIMYQSVRRHILEDFNLHLNCWQNLKSHAFYKHMHFHQTAMQRTKELLNIGLQIFSTIIQNIRPTIIDGHAVSRNLNGLKSNNTRVIAKSHRVREERVQWRVVVATWGPSR